MIFNKLLIPHGTETRKGSGQTMINPYASAAFSAQPAPVPLTPTICRDCEPAAPNVEIPANAYQQRVIRVGARPPPLRRAF